VLDPVLGLQVELPARSLGRRCHGGGLAWGHVAKLDRDKTEFAMFSGHSGCKVPAKLATVLAFTRITDGMIATLVFSDGHDQMIWAKFRVAGRY
jgi:hypothetical protein